MGGWSVGVDWVSGVSVLGPRGRWLVGLVVSVVGSMTGSGGEYQVRTGMGWVSLVLCTGGGGLVGVWVSHVGFVTGYG